jgi:hypothetical protein
LWAGLIETDNRATLMQIYAKNDQANLSAAEKNELKKLSEEFKRRHGR